MSMPLIAIRGSSRLPSIRSRTSPTSSPTRTQLFRPEQRHAIFVRMDGFAGGADLLVGPGGGPQALLFGYALRRQYLQLWLYRQPGHGKRGRRIHGGGAGLEGRDPTWDQEGVPVEH